MISYEYVYVSEGQYDSFYHLALYNLELGAALSLGLRDSLCLVLIHSIFVLRIVKLSFIDNNLGTNISLS